MSNLIWHTEKRKIKDLIPYELNPRKLSNEQAEKLKESLTKFNLVEIPVIDTYNKILAGHQRIKIMLLLGRGEEEIDVRVPNRELTKEEFKEYNLRSNIEAGEWDLDLLSDLDESFLSEVGFSSEELDDIFEVEDTPEQFDLKKELEKLQITQINIKKGDVWQIGNNRLMCGDSTIEEDVLKLMGNEKADMSFTDPPYILDYLNGKTKHGKATEGFGAKRDRRYLETDVLPPDFTEKWMANIAKVQKEHFSIIVYENWKNIRTIWGEMEKHESINDSNLFYCFVNIEKETNVFRFFIIPSRAVAGYVAKQHKFWLQHRPNTKDVPMRQFRIGLSEDKYAVETPLAKDYENKWNFRNSL